MSSYTQARLPRSQRRAQLLAAAQEVFVAQGYHAAAMDDIAIRAGVSKPVLYQHFPGKLELYLAILEQQAEELISRVRAAINTTSDNKARVHNAMAAYIDFVAADGEAFRLIFESDLRNEPAVRERVEGAYQTCMRTIAEIITTDTGVARERAELLAMSLAGAAEHGARFWLSHQHAISRTEAAELLAALAWRGISHFPLHG